MNYIRYLVHLLHEGRAITERVIMSSNSCEDCIHHSDIGMKRWYEASTVGEKRDQSRLTQKGALTAPVRDDFSTIQAY